MKKLFLFLFLLAASQLRAALWYCDNAASGSNNGTSWTNAWTSFSSIVWGASGVKAGDTLFISGGSSTKSYSGALTIGASGTSNTNRVTVRVGQDAGHNGTIVMDFGSASAVGITCFRDWVTIDGEVSGASHWQIKNIRGSVTLDTARDSGFGIKSYDGISRNGLKVRYMTINNVNNGLHIGSMSNFEISFCSLIGMRGDAAITCWDSNGGFDTQLIHDNVIEIWFNGSGGPDGIQTGNGLSIYNNTIRVIEQGLVTSSQHPDSIQVAGDNLKIYNNEFTNIGDSMVDMDVRGGTFANIYIYNNIFRTLNNIDPFPDMVRVYSNLNNGADAYNNIKICNNLFVDQRPVTGGAGNAISFGRYDNTGYVNTPTVSGIEIKNNIFMNCGGTGGNALVQISSNPNWTASSFGFNNNLYRVTTGTTPVLDVDGAAAYTFASWVAAQEPAGLANVTPTFVKYTAVQDATSDFHLAASDTAARNGGANLSTLFTTDKDGNPRPATGAWDRGPYQATAVVDTTPPTVLTSPAPIINSAGNQITVTFSEAVNFGSGGSGGWTTSMSGGASSMTYASGAGTTALVFTLGRTINAGETGTISYTQPGSGWRDTATTPNDLATVSGIAVTNNATAGQVATPTISLASGAYFGTQSVTLLCSTPGSSIHYTTDGSTPTSSSATYASALSLSTNTILKAIGTAASLTDSAVAPATYEIDSWVTVNNVWKTFGIPVQMATFPWSFDIIPSAGTDTVIGLGPSAVSDFTGMGPIVQFANDGTVNARNNTGYGAVNILNWTAGVSYHVVCSPINVGSHTYSVTVTPSGGATNVTATNYLFRDTQLSVTSLGYVGILSAGGTVSISNMSLGSTGTIDCQTLNITTLKVGP